jgi:predicted nucleotidyltransferase
MLGIPVSMIHKELRALEHDGVFSMARKGNLSLYRLNKTYPLFEELKGIVFKTVGVAGLLKDNLENIRGIKSAFLYGSFANESENATSDIDLFIIGSVDENKLITAVNRLEKQLRRDINYSLYTSGEFTQKKRKKDPFIHDVLSSPKKLIIGEKDEL